MSNIKEGRIIYIDLLKCFAIFLLIFGHVSSIYSDSCASIDWFNNYWLITFHMPLFSLMSGYFCPCNQQVIPFLEKKVRQLVLPLIFWCFIAFVLPDLINQISIKINTNESIHFQSIIRNFYYGISDWGWWFLRGLFFCFIYCYFFFHNKKDYILPYLSSIVLLWGISLCGIIPNRNPIFVGFIFLYPFFGFGIILRKYDIYISKYNRSLLLFFGSFYCILLLFWNGYSDSFYSMNTSMFEKNSSYGVIGWDVLIKTIYRFIIGICGSFTVMLLFKKLIDSNKVFHSVSFLSFIGQNTLAIYILQTFLVEIFKKEKDLFMTNDLYALVFISIVISLFILFFCLSIVYISNKNRLISFLFWGR